MARLGWVPLESETAREELALRPRPSRRLHLLRERLNSFDVEMLYELHYHMITLGKVFCAKLMPNCGACPLRDVCEYAMPGGKSSIDRTVTWAGILQPPTTAHAKQPVDIEDTGKSAPHSSTVHQNVGKNESTHVLRAIVTSKNVDKKGRRPGRENSRRTCFFSAKPRLEKTFRWRTFVCLDWCTPIRTRIRTRRRLSTTLRPRVD